MSVHSRKHSGRSRTAHSQRALRCTKYHTSKPKTTKRWRPDYANQEPTHQFNNTLPAAQLRRAWLRGPMFVRRGACGEHG